MAKKKISEMSAASVAAFNAKLGLTGLLAGTFTVALPTAPIATDKLYAYAGVDNTTIGGIAWRNGDYAHYTGSIWVRVPFQALTNYAQKKDSGIAATIVCSNGAVCDYNTATKIFSFNSVSPAQSILLYGDSSYVIPAGLTVQNDTIPSSARKLIFDSSNNTFSFISWNVAISSTQILIAVIRHITGQIPTVSANFPVSINGSINPMIPLTDDYVTAKNISNIYPMWMPFRVLFGQGSVLPIVNSTTKTLTFPKTAADYIFYIGHTAYTNAINKTINTIINLPDGSGGTAYCVLWEIATKTFSCVAYNAISTYKSTHIIFATFRISNGVYYFNMPVQYVMDGMINGVKLVTQNLLTANVKGINHRGYNTIAPENTLPAYSLSKTYGYAYVEADVEWTSDNVPVLLHDSTIDRTSNSTGWVGSKTLSELKLLDFGSWKSATYANTRIPTFQEFIIHCKKLNLHPYIETKGTLTDAQTLILVDIVRKAGMLKHVTWISFNFTNLTKILSLLPTARIGYVGTLSSTFITQAVSIKTDINDVFIDAEISSVTQALSDEALMAGVPVESWTIDNSSTVLSLVNWGVSGITTNNLNIADVLNL